MGWAREPRCVAVPGCGKGGMRLSNKGLICEPPCAPPLSATYASASIGSFSKRQETRPVHLERQHAREPFAPVNCLLWGQTRKSGDAIATSALPPTTDIPASGCDVRKVPEADVAMSWRTMLVRGTCGGSRTVPASRCSRWSTPWQTVSQRPALLSPPRCCWASP